MKRGNWALVAILSLTATLPLAAEGAGGLEFTQVVGRDLWPLPGASSLPDRTGRVTTAGAFGYGVDPDGAVTGGFGLGVSSSGLDLPSSPTGQEATSFRAGYGGVLHGWAHRWGPLTGLVISKVGFGGATWSGGISGFSLLGTAEAQIGYLVLPWFNLGLSAGVAGTVTFAPGQPFIVAFAPTTGLTLSWGSF